MPNPQVLARRSEVGKRIREFRQQRGRSQADVSRAAGITQASLSNYETGKRELPLSTALNLAAALDVPFGELVRVPDVIVLRDSRLGQAVSAMVNAPELIDTVMKRQTGPLEAAS
jgi:transcriptional regulator with XRE-family HTH domain